MLHLISMHWSNPCPNWSNTKTSFVVDRAFAVDSVKAKSGLLNHYQNPTGTHIQWLIELQQLFEEVKLLSSSILKQDFIRCKLYYRFTVLSIQSRVPMNPTATDQLTLGCALLQRWMH